MNSTQFGTIVQPRGYAEGGSTNNQGTSYLNLVANALKRRHLGWDDIKQRAQDLYSQATAPLPNLTYDNAQQVLAQRKANPMRVPEDTIGDAMSSLVGSAPMLHAVGGIAPLGIIKERGGNWLNGSVENALAPLRQGNSYPDPVWVRNNPEIAKKNDALNNFIDRQLTRYVKTDMATEGDPIRALAEQGILHVDPEQLNYNIHAYNNPAFLKPDARHVAQSDAAKRWEEASDNSVGTGYAGSHSEWNIPASEHAWLSKIDPQTLIYEVPDRSMVQDLGLDHLIDELGNSMNPESGLPQHLLLRPESLPRLSVSDAVKRVSDINAWRAAQKAEANAKLANNAATSVVKEYSDQGYRWVELKAPDKVDVSTVKRDPSWENPDDAFLTHQGQRQALQDALKYEGDTMGHCVGGYCDDVLNGSSRIFSLRDAKGQPHVTIETAPGDWKKLSAGNLPDPSGQYGSFAELVNAEREGNGDFNTVAQQLAEKYGIDAPPSRVVQIKGKQNTRPIDQYQPFISDFIKTQGPWSEVGDLRNTNLMKVQDWQYGGVDPEVLKSIGEYATMDEITQALENAKGNLDLPSE